VPPERICTINNGVDVQRFTSLDNSTNAVRSEFGFEQSTPVVGIVGRLRPQKDHSNFLNAAAQIKKSIPNVKFLIVGDGPLRNQLETQSRLLGLESSVLFCGVRQDIPAIMAALNVLVISSQWEGLPVTLLEGMAAGLPVVATAIDGIVGVAEKDKTTLLVPPCDSVALAQACIRILNDPLLAQTLGQAGLRRVTQKYSLDAMLRKILDLYEELWQNFTSNSRY